GGLSFEVDCPPLEKPILIDRAMWEKIVLNLLSNALKFTFEGTISVELLARSLHAELVIKDSGVGIPEQEVPNLFKRFHRVRETRARSAEGSGIGLWMVDHLARRLGAQLRVRSVLGVGTTFTIWMPYRTLRNPASSSDGKASRPAELARQVASEAARWVTDAGSDPTGEPGDVLGPPRLPPSPTDGARVLVVDDNADMRRHLTRLLSPRWRVDVATNGEEALAKLRASRPDLLLADVMMPNLDGFGLVRTVRADEALRSLPVIVVTAHAGEEAAIEGLRAGADDYVAKPFSARELIARIGGQLELARVRIERARAEAAVRASREELAGESAALLRLHEASTRLWRSTDLPAGLAEILDATVSLLGAEMGNVQLLNPVTRALEIVAQRGFGEEFLRVFREVSIDDASACGRSLRSGERTIIEDVDQDPEYAPFAAVARRAGYRAVQSTPLLGHDGEPLGMLSTHFRQPHRPSEQDLRRLDLYARQAVAFIERHHIEVASGRVGSA
ncbi:MAG TPA: response regulator, partial [Polyangia bacterium]